MSPSPTSAHFVPTVFKFGSRSYFFLKKFAFFSRNSPLQPLWAVRASSATQFFAPRCWPRFSPQICVLWDKKLTCHSRFSSADDSANSDPGAERHNIVSAIATPARDRDGNRSASVGPLDRIRHRTRSASISGRPSAPPKPIMYVQYLLGFLKFHSNDAFKTTVSHQTAIRATPNRILRRLAVRERHRLPHRLFKRRR
jgi:hypothetical protein